jgi:carboxyl-terminal processing protease
MPVLAVRIGAGARSRRRSRVIPTLPFVLLGLTLVVPSGAAAQASDSAAAVLEAYVAALGGREAMAALRTTEAVREREQFGSRSRVYRIEDAATRRFYQRVDSPDGVQETGYDGTRMWQKRAAFHGYLSEDEMQVRVFRNPEPDLPQYRESGRRYDRLPDETVDGRAYQVIAGVQHQPIGGDVPVKLYFDPATHLLRRRVYGSLVTVTQAYDDYRAADGVVTPFTVTTTQPQGTATVRTLLLRHNLPVADSVFQYRENGPPIEPPPVASTPQPDAAAGTATPPPVRAEPASAPSPAPASTLASGRTAPGELSDSLRLATFEYVWRKVDETYWDPTFGGVDWRAVHDRYRPLALATKDSRAFHDLLGRMVGELHRSHFHVVPPEQVVTATSTAADVASRATAHPGIELREVDGALLVTSVDSAFPAARAGIRPGYVLARIGGRTPEQVYEAWRRDNPEFELRRIAHVQAAQRALRGRAGDSVAVDVVDEHGRTVHRTLGLAPQPPGIAAGYRFESRRLPGDVGYVRFTLFFGDAVQRMRAAVDSLRDTRGLVIDLRGNPGGVGAMSREVASLFFRDSASLGTARFRHETQRFTFAGRGDAAYRGRVVILVDGHSGSTSEVLAAGMQELGRATVVGDTTAGAVLPSNLDVLPTGGSFQHPISDFHTPRGTVLEGRGVAPDVVARPSRPALLAGRDAVLERALALLREPTSPR